MDRFVLRKVAFLTMKILSTSLLCGSVLLCSIPVLAGTVVINEIMYHPKTENLLDSYIELHNTGTVATNVSGWKFIKGLQYTFPANTIIGPGGYLVVAADRAAFTNKYPGVLN